MTLFRVVFPVILGASVLVSAAGDIRAGESPAPLRLEECLALAARQSESLRAQVARQEEAGQRLTQARGGLLPALDFRASKLFQDTDGGRLAGEGLNTRVEAVQPLFYGFRKRNAVAYAEEVQSREDLQYRSLSRQVYGDVAQTFYAVAATEADMRNVRDTMKLMQDRIKELNERVRLGKSRDSEVLIVESEVAALRAQEQQSDGARRRQLETLALYTGRPAAALAVNDDRSPVTAAEPLDAVLAAGMQRSDIRVAQRDVALQEYQVRITRGALWPTVDLDGSWYLARSGSLSGADWDMYLLLDMPLYRGGTLRARLKEETFRLDEVRQGAALLGRQVETGLRQLHHTLVSSLAQAVAYREAYEKAERSYRLQQKEYRLGLVTNLEVLQAMTALLNAKSSFDRALIQVKLDQTMLDIATEKLNN